MANVSLVYNMPRLKEHYQDLLFGGWGVSTIFTARSGGYSTVTTGIDNALSGVANQVATTTAILTGRGRGRRMGMGIWRRRLFAYVQRADGCL